MPLKQNKPSAKEKGKPNSLLDSNNPYLLQHAYNPIRWREWNAQTLQEAKEQDKLIFLSIGYSTCYWCHVMEREVFEHQDIADAFHENFIPIKVDREERPDIDNIYIASNMIFNGNAGWPNNLFLTPDLKPFFAHTYLDKKTFKEYISKVERLWLEDREKVVSQAYILSEKVKAYLAEKPLRNTYIDCQKFPESLKDYLLKSFDSENGGFGQGTKFPREQDLDFLLDYADGDINHEAFLIARYSLDKMANGGINDHIIGGFHRYTIDNEWKIPHFEKMLYNQANMLKNYAKLYDKTGDNRYKEIAYSIISFVDGYLFNKKNNAYYSGLDAETDATEGAYYVWSSLELKTLLTDKELALLEKYFNSAEIPNFPGHKHPDGQVYYLKRNKPLKEPNKNKNESIDYKGYSTLIAKIKKAREKRKMPSLDYKHITEWNAMLASAFALSASVFEDKRLKAKAVNLMDFYNSKMLDKDYSLKRIYSKGVASGVGVLSDYAYYTRALLDSYLHLGKDKKTLEKAIRLLTRIDEVFADKEQGGFFFTQDDKNLFVREKGMSSSAYPSAVAVIMHNFLDMYIITNNKNYLTLFEDSLEYYKSWLDRGYMEEANFVAAILKHKRIMGSDYKKKISVLESKEVQNYVSESSSSSKVSFSVELVEKKSNLIKISVTLDILEGWHINANPASFEFLSPTVIKVVTDKEVASKKIKFPEEFEVIETPLGNIKALKGKLIYNVEIVLLSSKDKLNKIKFFAEFQACSNTTCLSPASEYKILHLND